jgi:hypothetical protein
MEITYFMSLVLDVDNGKGVNHSSLPLYAKLVGINKKTQFPFSLKDHLSKTK